MLNKILNTTLLLVAAVFAWQPQMAAAADISLELTPNVVHINAFYNGSTVEVKGRVPAGDDVLLRVSGEGEDLHLKKKGKVGGLLWMNTGDVSFENVPRVYMLYTGKDLADRIENPAIGLGFNALENRVQIKPAGGDNAFLFQEFIKLKKKEALYTISTDAIQYGAVENGVKSFSATLPVPPRMKQGKYTVEAFAVANNGVAGSSTAALNIKQVGFPAQLSNLAFNHALMHGVMAVVIALLAGLITGTLFKSKGGAH